MSSSMMKSSLTQLYNDSFMGFFKRYTLVLVHIYDVFLSSCHSEKTFLVQRKYPTGYLVILRQILSVFILMFDCLLSYLILLIFLNRLF